MNRRTKLIVGLLTTSLFIVTACIDKTPSHKDPLDVDALTRNQKEDHGTIVKAEDIQLSNPLNQQWITEGKNIYEVKCQPLS
jgi:hypothetical protein